MRRKKVTKVRDNKKFFNDFVMLATGKSYDEFVAENTKGLFLQEKREFIKNLNSVIKETKGVFVNVQ